MSARSFFSRQVKDIKEGGTAALFRKGKSAVVNIPTLASYFLVIPIVFVVRVLSPVLVFRFGGLYSSRIGHFAANTEVYLCEKDAGINTPKKPCIDIFFLTEYPVCNQQLLKMWKRILHVWPGGFVKPVMRVNRLIRGWELHEIMNSQHDRDIHNLLDRFPPHLALTEDEEREGLLHLQSMGINPGAPFVCLIVRDSAYMNEQFSGTFSYHNFRDSSIENYVLAAEKLAEQGYFVIRMGAKVHAPLRCTHPKVIDYATNGQRSDFMDIYLGAKCKFCISTGTGWEAIPAWLFRKPTIFTNLLPLGYAPTFSGKYLLTTKRHIDIESSRELTVTQIFSRNVGFCMATEEYEANGVMLLENTPNEIADAVDELQERLKGTWQAHIEDEDLQNRFWSLYPVTQLDIFKHAPLHGNIRALFAATYLRKNKSWLN
jgi:putative glycosyltransferase (TIGR04372 family)